MRASVRAFTCVFAVCTRVLLCATRARPYRNVTVPERRKHKLSTLGVVVVQFANNCTCTVHVCALLVCLHARRNDHTTQFNEAPRMRSKSGAIKTSKPVGLPRRATPGEHDDN